MEWIIGAVVIIGVFAFAQMAGNKIASDAWQVLPLAGHSKVLPENAPTGLEIASLVPGSRIVAFISRAGHEHPFAQVNLDVTTGFDTSDPTMLVTAAYHSPVWVSDDWASSDHLPPVGTIFHVHATEIDHVYAPGDALHEIKAA